MDIRVEHGDHDVHVVDSSASLHTLIDVGLLTKLLDDEILGQWHFIMMDFGIPIERAPTEVG